MTLKQKILLESIRDSQNNKLNFYDKN